MGELAAGERDPLFSVVIPTYNRAPMLRRALESVLAQTFGGFEVLVVDNHSDDDTLEVVASFNDPRVRVLRVHNHGVIAVSRNLGIRESRGEWIAFLDSDDRWWSDKLRCVRESLAGRAPPVLVAHDVLTTVNGQPRTVWRCSPRRSNVFESLLFVRNTLVTSAAVVRKDIALEMGGFSERPEFAGLEDYEFWLRLARIGDFVFITSVLGEWDSHDSNYSSTSSAEGRVAVGELHLRVWAGANPGKTITARRLRGRIWSRASQALVRGRQFRLARAYALRSLSINPFAWKPWASLGLSILRIPFPRPL